MNKIGDDIVQQPLIVGDDQHGPVFVTQRIDAVSHNFKSINIQTGIGFIQNSERRFENRHLQGFKTFFLAAGKTDIDKTLEHIVIYAQLFALFAQKFDKLHVIKFRFVSVSADGVDRML